MPRLLLLLLLVPRRRFFSVAISVSLAVSCEVSSAMDFVSWPMVARSADMAVAMLASASMVASLSACSVGSGGRAALAPW